MPSYDAAGDITLDTNPNGTHQYLYDAEGRVCAVESAAADGINVMTGYVYDAAGQRVAKGAIKSWSCDPSTNGFGAAVNETDYILDQSGHQITEMASDPSGNMVWMHTNVWAAGQLIGTYDADGLHFYQNDWLGTRRAQTDYAGVQQQTCTSLPFGDGLNCSGAGQYAPSLQYPTEHHFTGKERDAESGNDYFGARYYASSVGTFLSPDWSAKEEPVPYAKLDNPQTLNLYQYLRNNPLGGVDPDGHDGPVILTPEGPIILPFPAAGPSLTQQQYNEMGNEVGGFVSTQLGYLKDIIVGDVTHPIQSLTTLFSGSGNTPGPAPATPNDAPSPATSTGPTTNTNPYAGPVSSPVTVVDPKGNAIPVGAGEQLQGSKDGKWTQVKDANGQPTGTRIDGGHPATSHPDPRAQVPHAHVPGTTNDDGTPWLPVKQ